MDQADCYPNSNEVIDFVKLLVNPKSTDIKLFADLYLKGGLTTRQVAAQTGLSKTAIIRRLHQLGIKKEATKADRTDAQNSTSKVSTRRTNFSGNAEENRLEMKAARTIVELRKRQRLSWAEVVRQLKLKGFTTKTGKGWTISNVRKVFARWNGKV